MKATKSFSCNRCILNSKNIEFGSWFRENYLQNVHSENHSVTKIIGKINEIRKLDKKSQSYKKKLDKMNLH